MFHVVPWLALALKAVDAGVDGLVVEGGEGGGFKSPTPVSTMVLLPLVCSHVDVPVIAAGGICDGRTMAAAFALVAEGVQMGTRMPSSAESPVHENWKRAIVNANETDTVFLNRNWTQGELCIPTDFLESGSVLSSSLRRRCLGVIVWIVGGMPSRALRNCLTHLSRVECPTLTACAASLIL